MYTNDLIKLYNKYENAFLPGVLLLTALTNMVYKIGNNKDKEQELLFDLIDTIEKFTLEKYNTFITDKISRGVINTE